MVSLFALVSLVVSSTAHAQLVELPGTTPLESIVPGRAQVYLGAEVTVEPNRVTYLEASGEYTLRCTVRAITGRVPPFVIGGGSYLVSNSFRRRNGETGIELRSYSADQSEVEFSCAMTSMVGNLPRAFTTTDFATVFPAPIASDPIEQNLPTRFYSLPL